MKKIFLLSGVVLSLNADISNIISLIRSMEGYKPEFKKISGYNPFYKTVNLDTQKESNASTATITLKEKNFVLNAVFQNKANINGKWVKVGESVEGYKVVKITSSGVWLKKGGRVKKITLKSNILKVTQ